MGSNIVDLTFVVPGTNSPALTSGFGAVYADSDIAGVKSFEYFDASGVSLGSFEVPTFNNGYVQLAYGSTAGGVCHFSRGTILGSSGSPS
jgi:hypothetical protein